MTTTELLAKFADPDLIHTLSASDKLFAGLMATILGMGITFASLILLQFVIALMAKVAKPADKSAGKDLQQQPVPSQPVEQDATSDSELIAVISSVIALQLKTSVNNIVIRNIERTADSSPAWNKAGIIEQMDCRQ